MFKILWMLLIAQFFYSRVDFGISLQRQWLLKLRFQTRCNFNLRMKNEDVMISPLSNLGVYLGVLIAATSAVKTRVSNKMQFWPPKKKLFLPIATLFDLGSIYSFHYDGSDQSFKKVVILTMEKKNSINKPLFHLR